MISPLLDSPADGDKFPDATLPPAAEDTPLPDDPLTRMEALMAAGARDAAIAHAEAEAATWTAGTLGHPVSPRALARCTRHGQSGTAPSR